MMTHLNFTPLLEEFRTTVAPVGGLVLLMALAWVVWRSGSIHIVRYRVWRLLHGRSDIADAEIKRFIEERSALMAFRFFSGIKSRTLSNAHSLIRWSKDNNEDVREIRMAGGYFDGDALRIRTEALPGWKAGLSVLIGGMLTASAATFAIKLGTYDHALFKVNATGTWFSVQADRFGPSTWKGQLGLPMIELDACRQQQDAIKTADNLQPVDVNVLCALLQSDGASGFIAKTLLEQRATFASIALVLGCLSCAFFVKLLKSNVAQKMSERNRQ